MNFLPHYDAQFNLCLDRTDMTKCTELLPLDFLIRYLYEQAVEEMYLTKWLVSPHKALILLKNKQTKAPVPLFRFVYGNKTSVIFVFVLKAFVYLFMFLWT